MSDFEYHDGGAAIANPTLTGSLLYRAGLDRGDVIFTVGDDSLISSQALDQILGKYVPSDTVEITYLQNNDTLKTTIVLEEDQELEVIPIEQTDQTISNDKKEFRDFWLHSRAGNSKQELVQYCPECHRAFPFAFDYCAYDGSELQPTLESK